MNAMTESSPSVRGECQIMLAMDIGFAIDLDHAERLTARQAQRENIRHRRRSPSHFAYRPAPLRLSHALTSSPIAGIDVVGVELVLYDFGAAGVIYHVPIQGTLASLIPLASMLYGHEAMLHDARERVDRLVETIRESIDRPQRTELVEDYIVYRLDPASVSATEFVALHATTIAQVLRAEAAALSGQQVAESMSSVLSYGLDDAAVIDWNAAIVIDAQGDDILAILEFANVELMELRQLDEQLDEQLDQAYRTISRPGLRLLRGSDMRRLGRLQVEGALLYEGVNNALKLLGDQFLAKAYSAASNRLHIPEWDSVILRKLQTIESIYEKLDDRLNTVRMELLEWIIIVLIAFEIVMSLIR
jgi:hypothetical protein